MERQAINIVWLKRDLRISDHGPLFEAEQQGLPYLIIFIFEPSVIGFPDTSLRHLQFQYHSLQRMDEALAPFDRKVILFYAEALTVFDYLHQQFDVGHVFSYQESGIQVTYERDKRIAKYFKANGVRWKQFQRDGVIRGIKNREGWDKKWYAAMSAPALQNRFSKSNLPAFGHPFSLPHELEKRLSEYPEAFQPPGTTAAYRYLQSFVEGRAKNYSRHISKPQESRASCSRISPYLSWGNLSVRQAWQFAKAYQHEPGLKVPLQHFLTRLKWHCHFKQKFETDIRYETQCINAGFELVSSAPNESHLAAWKEGRTGVPLVDACMRCLQATGWINFRMRAMLVSFLCHHLNQDWRLGAHHLARLFLDYEPGIHYPQFQMQAGTTGVNTVRIYNPVKQSWDHDPQGLFIKRWVPELRPVPTPFIHEPHLMTPLDQQFAGIQIGTDYPMPLVALEAAAKAARERLWGHRKHPLVQQQNELVLERLTRQKK